MPRSSRHKSSKHSAREGREYSDSEKDSVLKEKKGKEGSAGHRVSRDYASGEKRKHESKAGGEGKDGGGNVDFVEEYVGSSSKKRKEKVEDDRWTGGDVEERESTKVEKDSKGTGDLKSRSRRGNESSGRVVDVDEGKKSGGGKGDSKHHRSERKERGEKEGGSERDRKGKEYSTSERFVDGEVAVDIVGLEGSRKKVIPLEDGNAEKHVSTTSGIVSLDEKRNPEHDRELERRPKRKDSSNGVDLYPDGKEADDRRPSSRNEIVRSGKYKDDGHKDDRYKDKYGEDMVKDSRFQDEKQQHRDGRHARDYVSSRSDEKYARNEKKDVDVQQKKSKPQDSERDHVRSRHHDDRDRDDRKRDVDRDDRDGDHDGGRDLDRDRGRDLEHDRGRDRDRARDFDRDRGRDRDRHHREHDREHDRDYGSHLDERSSRYKEERSRRRSPDDFEDYYNDKTKSVKAEPHADREKSVSRKAHSEAVAGSARGKASPTSRSHMNVDKYRDNTHDDSKYGDSRQVLTTPDKSSKYPTFDKTPKLEDRLDSQRARDPSVERSPKKKASPHGLLEKSPSTTSFDRKFANRSDRRRSLDVDEAERRSSGSNNAKDGSNYDDRQGKDLSPKKSLGEDQSPVESSFHRKSNQGNGPFHGHGQSNYKSGAGSPLVSSIGDDSRGHNNRYKSGADSPLVSSMGEDSRAHNNRYRRSVDPNNTGRAHQNSWKGVQNWHNPLQSGFMPFPHAPHGPPHGVFQSHPQYPSPMFSVRPPIDMSHSGIPYHMPDADRFANHMRPIAWQNMVDGSGPSHFPGWDANNGVFRDDSSMYGPPGIIPNGRVRETNADIWKQNGDVKLEAGTGKDAHATDDPAADDAHTSQHTANIKNEELGAMNTPNGDPLNEALVTANKVSDEKVPESPAADEGPKSLRAYLSRLEISVELTDPQLYNEFVSLAVIDPDGNFEDMEDVKIGISKVVDASEMKNVLTDISLFPAAEDSIFQRAMDLFKIHNIDRRSFQIFDVDAPPIDSAIEVMEQGQGEGGEEEVMEEEIDEPSHSEEVQVPPMEQPSSDDTQIEQMETPTLLISTIEACTEPSHPVDMEVKEMVGVEYSSPKPTSPDVLKSIDDDTEMSVAEAEDGDIKPASFVVEQLDSEVSGSLNLPHGSVKVCEGLMPVSNECESESVTITRVLDAPESTH